MRWNISICRSVLKALEHENEEKIATLVNFYWRYKPRGTTQGHLIYDDQATVINRVGRVSLNEPWYRQAYKRFGHKPTKKELHEFVLDELRYGRYNELEEIPEDADFLHNELVIELLKSMLIGVNK